MRAKHFLISHDGTVKLAGLRTAVSMMQNGIRCSSIHEHSSATVNNICWLAPEVLAQVSRQLFIALLECLLNRTLMDIQKIQIFTVWVLQL